MSVTLKSTGRAIHLRTTLKPGLGLVAQFLLGFVIMGSLAAPAYLGYEKYKAYTVESNVTEAISQVRKSVTQYAASGNDCTGFTLANARVYFGTRYAYNNGTITLPGGDITMTAECSRPVGNTSLNRVGLDIAGVDASTCTTIVNAIVTSSEALQVNSGSSDVVVKRYREKNPSGRSAIGNTACAADTTSTITAWLK